MADINLYKYKLDNQYHRNDKTVLFDSIRKIFVPATPEEEVRQRFIQYLIEEIGIPTDNLETEVHLTHFKRGACDRADIIGYYIKNGVKIPLFIVECKKPGVALTENVIEQVSRYDEIVKSCGFLFITNGDMVFQVIKGHDNVYLKMNQILNYAEMIANKDVDKSPFFTYHSWRRPTFEKLNEQQIKNDFIERGWVGEGSNQEYFPLIANLASLFMDASLIPTLPIRHNKFTIIDQGLRLTEFGNAGGGSYPGEYRYFLLEDNTKNNIIVSIGIKGKLLSDFEPGFGKMNGHTSFIVAIDDFEKSHNSLQLDLDLNIVKTNNSFGIFHKGTLTAGKNGSVSPTIVLNYVNQKAPHLIQNNKIFLGSLPSNRLMNWEDAKPFLLNSIEYALLRDEIRLNQKSISNKTANSAQIKKQKNNKTPRVKNTIQFNEDFTNKIIVTDFSVELNFDKTVKTAILEANIPLPIIIDLVDEGKNCSRDFLKATFYFDAKKRIDQGFVEIEKYESINRKDMNKIHIELGNIISQEINKLNSMDPDRRQVDIINIISFNEDFTNKIVVTEFIAEFNHDGTVKTATLDANIPLPYEIDLEEEGKNYHRDYLKATLNYDAANKIGQNYLAINMYKSISIRDFNKIHTELSNIALMKVNELNNIASDKLH